MKDIFEEAKRGLDKVVTSTTSDTWVNKDDALRATDQRVTEEFRATPLERRDILTPMEYAVENPTVKDRDVVESTVDEPQVAEGPETKIVTGDFEAEPVSEADVDVVDNPAFRADTADVPSGNIKKVLAWVDGDADRARAALEVENQDDTPRSTLISELEDIIEDEEEN